MADRHPHRATYKLVAVPGDRPTFYLLQFLEPAKTKTPDLSWANPGNFTGRVSLFNQAGKKVLATVYTRGKVTGFLPEQTKDEFEEWTKGTGEGKTESPTMQLVCVTVTTQRCTDWYRIYSDGSREYIGRTCSGSTSDTVCSGGGGSSGGHGGSTGGGGGGPTGGGSGTGGSAPCGDPVHGCFKKEVLDKLVLFRGEIDASDLANHPKANCIYGKLSQTHTMGEVVSAFAGESTNFDLVIEVDNLDLGTHGILESRTGSNTFTMKINGRELDRTPIEIAGTFLHEALHAEMRRYLYGATDTSTLPGFPGDFSSDWEAFVNEIYNGNPKKADHEVMAAKYISTIADGLEEYGGEELTRAEYEGIAWIGLRRTDYYTKLLSDSERTEIDNNIKSAKNSANETCN